MHRGDYWPPRDPGKLVNNTSAGNPERRRRLGEDALRRARTKRRRAATTRCVRPVFFEGVEHKGVETACRRAVAQDPAAPAQCAMTVWRVVVTAAALAWSDMRQRHMRSFLGLLSMPVRMAIMVAALGFAIGCFSGGGIVQRLPMLALSLTAWTFLNGVVIDATTALRRSASLVRDRTLPPVVVLLQCVFRHALFALHYAGVPLLLWIFLAPPDIADVAAALPGLVLFGACTLGLSLVLGTLATRFDSLRSVIAPTLIFASSPVILPPEMVDQDSVVTRLNPLTHLFAVWREPLASGHVATASEIYVLVCSAALVLASVAAIVHLRRAAFWI